MCCSDAEVWDTENLFSTDARPEVRGSSHAEVRRAPRRDLPVIQGVAFMAGRVSLLAMLPTIVTTMDYSPVAYLPGPQFAVPSTLVLLCSSLWYMAGTNAIVSTLAAVPGLVEVVVDAIEEIISEAVHGTRILLRCIVFTLAGVAMAAVVRGAHWLRAIYADRFGLEDDKRAMDAHELRYGGRLLGGGKLGQGLSAKEVFPDQVSEPAVMIHPEFLSIGIRYGWAKQSHSVTLAALDLISLDVSW